MGLSSASVLVRSRKLMGVHDILRFSVMNFVGYQYQQESTQEFDIMGPSVDGDGDCLTEY